MPKLGPIIIIDDDPDDQEMIQRVISKLGVPNEIKRFYDGEEALHYFLTTTDSPLLVICDINMPLMNGMELKKQLEAHPKLRAKKIPFVFLTTTTSRDQVLKAYEFPIQGFFVKGQSYLELEDTVKQIIGYWKKAEPLK